MALPNNALGAYLSVRDRNQQAGLADLQGLIGQVGLASKLQGMERERQFRSDLAALGPNATQDQLAQVAANYASPDDVLKSQTASADRKLQREIAATQFAQNLQQRQDALAQQKELALSRAQDKATQDAINNQFKQQQMILQQQNAAFQRWATEQGLDIKRLLIQGQQDQRDQARDDRLDRGVMQFSNELQQNKLPSLTASITKANEALKQFEGQPDIPGIGLGEGSDMVPNWMRTEAGKNVRSALKAVSNDLLNLYSGMAVTLPEAERRELEEMKNGAFNEADFKNAWPRIVNRYNSVIGNMAAGAPPEVLERYRSRPGALKLEPLVPAFGGTVSQVPNVPGQTPGRLRFDAQGNPIP